jgi:hypothetical protein
LVPGFAVGTLYKAFKYREVFWDESTVPDSVTFPDITAVSDVPPLPDLPPLPFPLHPVKNKKTQRSIAVKCVN